EFSFDPPRIEETRIDEEDWANTWKRYYKPILVGERLLICPLWEEASREDLAGRELVKMDPGMAFGTGGHDTTRLCMELMEREITPDSSVLDIGCGSGILSIAALKLGAKNAVCVDIDPVATRVVFENAAHNGIANERLRVHCGNILNDTALQNKVAGQYDCVAANIVADVILALSEFVPGLVKSGGCFVCSGIVLERADEVERALVRAGFVDIARRVSEETADAGALSTKWVAFCAKK
ncbi:50S ribosomal protein L11 methyltransferase, partial [Christensenellaceae bacterium OttesenSCG-928-L17]|nr:50S ribosomal protein L11 methyltransferase [Christensenellaceae bacterium OttesenSCG-928-L17]